MSDSNGEKKTLEERLEAIVQTVELLGLMQLATEKKMAEADARLQATFDQIAAIQLDTGRYMNQIGGKLDQIAKIQLGTDQSVNQIGRKLDQIATIQLDTDQSVNQIGRKLDQIATIQLDTDQHMNLLARVAASHDARITSLEGDAA